MKFFFNIKLNFFGKIENKFSNLEIKVNSILFKILLNIHSRYLYQIEEEDDIDCFYMYNYFDQTEDALFDLYL